MMTDRQDVLGVIGGDETGAGIDWAIYAGEVLGHWRLAHHLVAETDLAAGDVPRLLLFPRPPRLSESAAGAVRQALEQGSCALAVGGAGTLSGLGGAPLRPRGEGHVTGSGADLPLHAYGGVELAGGGAVLAAWDGGGPAIAEYRVGAGRLLVVGVDVWQTIVRIQQGRPIAADGEGAPDGSAPVDDGILKTDDGIALSYAADRALPGGGSPAPRYAHQSPAEPTTVPIFHRPQADLWRDLLLRLLVHLAGVAGIALPWLHYWPAGVEAVAHFSNDSDGNVDAEAKTMLDGWAEGGVKGTWCYLYPGGLSHTVLRRVVAEGHEMALHHNALDGGDHCRWGFEHLAEQVAWFRREAAVEGPISNKNHYLRWEGWDDFFLWCERLGIALDQSHGPSKQGNVGYPFGSSHLSFPLSGERGGRLVDVLAQPLQCQDLWLTTPEANREVFIDQALAHHGIAHFLFHGRNLFNHPEIAAAMRTTIRRVGERGLPAWTAAQLNRWERWRRGVHVATVAAAGGWNVRVESGHASPESDAAVLVPAPQIAAGTRFRVDPDRGRARVVKRHGITHVEVAMQVAAGVNELRVRPCA